MNGLGGRYERNGKNRTVPDCIELEVVRVTIAAVAALFVAGCGGSTGARTDTDLPPEALDFRVEGWKTDFAKREVPLSEFRSGGPPKDGIPAIDVPRFVPLGEVDFLRPQEPVIELIVNGQARAYPIQILIWHEIANDTVAGVPVAVTFCPLCNTALVFDRRLDGQVLDFGTTGNLRSSDLVMYDRQTESWWQQFGGEAVVGELAGAELEHLPARIVAWEDFAARHPGSEVLSRDTGHNRAYGANPYRGYDDVDSGPLFGAKNSDDDRLAPKERVVFIERGDDAVAVPFTALEKLGRVEVEVGGESLEVLWVPGVRSALDETNIFEGRTVGSAEVRSLDADAPVAFDTPFWFTVAAFRPDVEIVRD